MAAAAGRAESGPVQPRSDPVFAARATRVTAIASRAHGKPARHHPGQCRHPDHGLWRLGLPRPARDPRALQARLPHPRRGAAAGTRRPPATARPGRPDPRGAGEPALSGLGRGRGARRRRPDQSGRHPVRARAPAVRRRAGVRRRIGGAGGIGLRRADWCTSPRSAPTRTRPRPMPAPRAWARSSCSPPSRRRRCCGRRWCSGRRTISSTASPRSPGSRRRCRWSAAATPASSRSMSATSPRPWSRRSRAAPSPAASTSSAGREVKTFKELLQYVLAVTGRKRLLVPLPFALAELQAWFLQFLPKPPLTPDQVELLKTDNVVSDAAKREGRTLEGARHRAGRDGGDRADISVAVPQDRPVQGQERRHVSNCHHVTVVTNVEDLRQIARRRLPRALFDYAERGSYDELTLRANRADLDAIRLRQRVLVDVSKISHRHDAARRDRVAAGRHRADRHGRSVCTRRRGAGRARRAGRRHAALPVDHVDLHHRGRARGDDAAVLVPALHVPRPRLLQRDDRAGARRRTAPRCSSPSTCRCAASATWTSRTA